mmetsp:Transcript_5361/g.19601  ORF Transcript_5361/g.19601 Transcript_5361/m.19601 type:complete len:446 (+) Transcript_5361:53-1390(+)
MALAATTAPCAALAAPAASPAAVGNRRSHMLRASRPAQFTAVSSACRRGHRLSRTASLRIACSAAEGASAPAAAAAPATEAPVATASSDAELRFPPATSTIMVTGPTSYIGRNVVKQLVAQGFNTVSYSRPRAGAGGKLSTADIEKDFEGAECVFGQATSMEQISEAIASRPEGKKVDAMICCLASRGGGVEDSWLVDYQATVNCLNACIENDVKHFVLLSAICVQRPLLEFQRAKIVSEDLIRKAGAEGKITYSIVQPTAFFKSLAGQVESVMGGGPYVMFGNGELTACKPIGEIDLANYCIECLNDPTKNNQTLPIGGPGPAYTPLAQGQLLFKLLGKEENFVKAPVGLMDAVIGGLDFLKKYFPGAFTDPAEFGRIGRYYATESMLLLDPETDEYTADGTPEYGTLTLEQFFKDSIENGLSNQELGDASFLSWGKAKEVEKN